MHQGSDNKSEDMPMTDQELRDLITSIALLQKETALQSKETDRELKELSLAQKETDKQIKETDKQLKETDRQLKENDRRLSKQLKELGIQLGGIGNKFGSFTEGMAFPAMERILREHFGLETISTNVKSQKGDGELELDVLGYSNGTSNTVVIVEVKSHLTEKGIAQVLNTLAEFPKFFPELAHKKLYGMIATVAASKEVKQKTFEAGLYLGTIHDEQFKLAKPARFNPKCFTL
jgi:hypothetical protein